ncbi:MAG: threonine synthase [Firmicutes bacterium]|nr:threonine synthase [Bacillota bacterium]
MTTLRDIKCVSCGATYPVGKFVYKCPQCNGILEIRYDYEAIKKTDFLERMQDYGTIRNIWDFQELLPVDHARNIVSLEEGNTPILEYADFVQDDSKPSLFIKDESRNPTGSFKDRPLSVAISKVKEDGSQAIITSTHGNAGVAMAAYAAKARLDSYIIVPDDTEVDKVVMMQAFGSKVFQIEGDISDAYNFSLLISDELGLVNLATTFLSPYTTEGDKTIAFEVYKQFQGNPPEWMVFPIGAGPLLVGCYKGFKELMDLGLLNRMPKLVAVQSEKCAPIAKAYEQGLDEVAEWREEGETIAVGIHEPLRGYPEDGTITLQRIKESGGIALTVSDNEIVQAMFDLARKEAIFPEPTGAVGFAGAMKLYRQNQFKAEDRVLVLISGSGYKESGGYKKYLKDPVKIERSLAAFKTHFGGESDE